ncbi:MAG: peptidoglycan DD-metalloendopeptidase family protein [Actinomycetota bacterium]
MSSFLPVSAMWWIYLGPVREVVELPVPAGVPIHVALDGRVIAVDRQAVGEVVVRSGDRRLHYRRLRSASIQVDSGSTVRAGDVLGVVAAPADGARPQFIFGVQDVDGDWLDPFQFLVGAGDPAELASSLAPPIRLDSLRAPSSASNADAEPMPASTIDGPVEHIDVAVSAPSPVGRADAPVSGVEPGVDAGAAALVARPRNAPPLAPASPSAPPAVSVSPPEPAVAPASASGAESEPDIEQDDDAADESVDEGQARGLVARPPKRKGPPR